MPLAVLVVAAVLLAGPWFLGRASASDTVHAVPGTYTVNGISCVDASRCVAVGTSAPGGVVIPVVDGVPGTPVVVPTTTELRALDCPSSTTCYAVGYETTSQSSEVAVEFPVTVASDGSVTVGSNGCPADECPGRFDAISCPTATTCVAVGNAPDPTVGEYGTVVIFKSGGFDGSQGLFLAAPPPYQITDLDGVSCFDSTQCLLVGHAPSGGAAVLFSLGSPYVGTTKQEIGEQYDNSSIFRLNGVTCNGTSCLAVGNANDGSAVSVGLTPQADGSLTASATSSLPDMGLAYGVACSSAHTCEVVGEDLGGASATGSVAVLQDGVPQSGRDVAGTVELLSVACPSTSGACEASGATSATGATADLGSPYAAPQITTQPSNTTVGDGATASFSAAASGFPTPTVQWQTSTDGGTTFSDISGATDTTYSFTASFADTATEYRAVFTNGSGSATTASATLTVNPPPPDTTITSGPSGLTSNASPSFAFTSSEAGSKFQCKLDGPGSTTGSYAPCASPMDYSNLANGSYTFSVYATNAGGSSDATPATHTFTVDTTQSQSITWSQQGPYTYGQAPVTLNATASSGLAVSYTVTSGPCSVSGSTLTITGAGSCVVAASQNGSTNYSAAPTVSQTIVVNKAAQSITWSQQGPYTYGHAPVTLNATASSGLAVSYTVTSGPCSVSGSTLTITGAGSCVVAASQNGSTNYSAAPTVSQTIVVNKAAQSITWSQQGPYTYGQAPVTLNATASSGLAVSYTVTSGPCSVNGTTLTITGAGSCVVAASQNGSTNYSAAPTVSQTIVVNKAAQSITWSQQGPYTYGQAPVTLNATASSGLAVSYTVTSGPCSVNGTTLTITGAGSCVVAASQNGSTNYSAAPTVSQTIVVNKAAQSITWSQQGPYTYGQAPVTLNATASSGLAVSYTVTSGPCSVNGTTLTITGAGSCVVAASQNGSTNYSAAPTVSQTIVVNKAATVLSAPPAHQVLLWITFSATLTSAFTGHPIAGQTVSFSEQGHPLCAAMTNSQGVAGCTATGVVIGPRTYTASYAGNADYLASTANGKL